MKDSNDKPIKYPKQDKLGLAPFAQTVTNRISEAKNPVGLVIAIIGPWGIGKSSAVNLVKYYIKKKNKSKKIKVIDFKCWLFRGEEALFIEFLKVFHWN